MTSQLPRPSVVPTTGGDVVRARGRERRHSAEIGAA